MTKATPTQTAPTSLRQVRLATLDARLAGFRMQQGYAGGMPPLVAAQLSALQNDIRGELSGTLADRGR